MSSKFLKGFTAAIVLAAGSAYADGSSVRVHNQTRTTVTVNTESGYGCTADSGDTCSFAISSGKHTLKAQRHDSGAIREQTVDVPAGGYDFQLSDGNP